MLEVLYQNSVYMFIKMLNEIIGYKDLLPYFSTITTPSSCPIKHNTKQSLLDVRFNIKNMLHGFFWLHISLRMKEKILAPPKPPI
jgi:hypothetical protein